MVFIVAIAVELQEEIRPRLSVFNKDRVFSSDVIHFERDAVHTELLIAKVLNFEVLAFDDMHHRLVLGVQRLHQVIDIGKPRHFLFPGYAGSSLLITVRSHELTVFKYFVDGDRKSGCDRLRRIATKKAKRKNNCTSVDQRTLHASIVDAPRPILHLSNFTK